MVNLGPPHLVSFSPELGGIPGLSGPTCPLWKEECSGSGLCSVYEHNSECRAIEVIGQVWSSEVVALFLEDRELGEGSIELPHGNGPSLPRNEGCFVGIAQCRWGLLVHCAVSGRFSCGRVRGLGAWRVNCHSKKESFSHRGRAVTVKERDVVRVNKEGV